MKCTLLIASAVLVGAMGAAVPAYADSTDNLDVSFTGDTQVIPLAGVTVHGKYSCNTSEGASPVYLDVVLRQGARSGYATVAKDCGVTDEPWQTTVVVVGVEDGVQIDAEVKLTHAATGEVASMSASLVRNRLIVAVDPHMTLHDDVVHATGTYTCGLEGVRSFHHTFEVAQELGNGGVADGSATVELPCVLDGTWSVDIAAGSVSTAAPQARGTCNAEAGKAPSPRRASWDSARSVSGHSCNQYCSTAANGQQKCIQVCGAADSMKGDIHIA